LRGDPYENSDAVFGVKDSLIVDMPPIDPAMASKYQVDKSWSMLTYDFVLVTEKEAKDLRIQKSVEAMQSLGRKVRMLDDLPVPDVD
jgi:hypothetical protein